MGLFSKLFGKGKSEIKAPRMVKSEHLVEDADELRQPLDFWGDHITVIIKPQDISEIQYLRKANQVIDWLNVNQFRIDDLLSASGQSSDTIIKVTISAGNSIIEMVNGVSVELTEGFELV